MNRKEKYKVKWEEFEYVPQYGQSSSSYCEDINTENGIECGCWVCQILAERKRRGNINKPLSKCGGCNNFSECHL